jgi:hypothetical protein
MDSLWAATRCSNVHASGYMHNLICHDRHVASSQLHKRTCGAQLCPVLRLRWRAALAAPSPEGGGALLAEGAGLRFVDARRKERRAPIRRSSFFLCHREVAAYIRRRRKLIYLLVSSRADKERRALPRHTTPHAQVTQSDLANNLTVGGGTEPERASAGYTLAIQHHL